MSKKFELVRSDTKSFFGGTLYRIRALKDFSVFKAGELGGYVEKEENLSQDGNAWVSGDARVSGNARVCGDARVSGDAWVYGDAWVSGNAWVYGDAQVYGNAWVYGDVKIDFVLCSRFNFEYQAQLDKWLELEKQFEEIKDTLKDKPKTLEEMTKEELITKIKQLEQKGVN